MDDVKQLRLSLWENGYRPVAVITQTKKPLNKNYLETAMWDPPQVIRDGVDPDALSTGIVCSGVRAIDIDIDDKEMADEIERIMFDTFGETITRIRMGSSRRLCLYSTRESESQKRVLEFERGGAIEVLGTKQKFTAFGIHEDGMPYEWINGISPLEIPADRLAGITEAQISTFFEACGKLYPIKKKDVKPAPIIPQSFEPIQEGRARNYALSVLESITTELACLSKGGRNNALNSAAMRLGGMHARGWLTAQECQSALIYACNQNGLMKEDGANACMKTFVSGWSAGIEKPAIDPIDRQSIVKDSLTIDQQPAVKDSLTPEKRIESSANQKEKKTPSSLPSKIIANPYEWRNSLSIQKREWIYGSHLTRKFISLTIAPGAVGKTSLLVADALSMVSGKDFLGTKIYGGPKRVWLWNLEDPRDEIERRIVATMERYDLIAEDIGDRLYLDSGRDNPLCMARQEKNGVVILKPVIDALVEELKAQKIDVLIIDPFVSSHNVSENDNGAIDAVAKAWGYVADQADCAIELVHHIRKTGDSQATAESSRGAVSLIAAARSVRVLNRMTKTEADKAGLDTHRGYFRAYDDKNNLAPASTESHWFQLESVYLANGDDVGVVVPWRWPNANQDISPEELLEIQRAIDGKNYREDSRSGDWVGNAIGEVLDLDISDETCKTRIKYLIKFWLNTGALIVIDIKDKKSMARKAIAVGEWAVSPVSTLQK